MWFLFAFFSGLGSAIFALIIKMYLKNINTFFLSFIFFFIATLMLFGLGIYTNKINYDLLTNLKTKEFYALLGAGIVNALAFTLYLTALNCGNVCKVVAIDRLAILYVVLMSFFILNQSFSIKAVVGSLLMVFGAFLLS